MIPPTKSKLFKLTAVTVWSVTPWPRNGRFVGNVRNEADDFEMSICFINPITDPSSTKI